MSLPLFPFVRGEVLPATSSSPHLNVISCSTLLCLLSSSPAFLSPPISTLASIVSSYFAYVHNSAGILIRRSVIRHPFYTCSAHCHLFITSLSVKLLSLMYLPLTPPFFACLPSLLLLFFGPSCSRTLAAFVVVVRSVPRFPFRTGKLV